jgi:DNA-binding LytR/AlgR family response regulator
MGFRPAGCLVGFAGIAYVVTVLSTAFYNYRTLYLNGEQPVFASMLLWQALIYSIWIPVGAWVWRLFRRGGLSRRSVVKYVTLGLLLIPIHTILSMLILDTKWASPGTIDLRSMAAQRAQLDILVYASFGVLALAAFFQRRAAEEAKAASDLKSALGAARVALTKPGKPSRVEEQMMVSVGSRRVIVPLRDVEYFGSAGNYVVVNWAGKEGLLREPLLSIEKRIDPEVFARTHRGAIANLSAVAAAEPLSDGSWRLTMASGAEIVVSRTYRDAILSRLGRTSSST